MIIALVIVSIEDHFWVNVFIFELYQTKTAISTSINSTGQCCSDIRSSLGALSFKVCYSRKYSYLNLYCLLLCGCGKSVDHFPINIAMSQLFLVRCRPQFARLYYLLTIDLMQIWRLLISIN